MASTMGLLLAGGQGDDLVHLLVDAAGLVDDGQGVVQPLQPLGHGGQDLEAGPRGRDGHLVGVLLDPLLQLGVELHHPDGDPERQTGLAFVGGDHHHLGALNAGQQLIQGQHGRQGGLALPSGSIQPASRGRGR